MYVIFQTTFYVLNIKLHHRKGSLLCINFHSLPTSSFSETEEIYISYRLHKTVFKVFLYFVL